MTFRLVQRRDSPAEEWHDGGGKPKKQKGPQWEGATTTMVPVDEFVVKSDKRKSGYVGVDIDDRKEKPFYTRGGKTSE